MTLKVLLQAYSALSDGAQAKVLADCMHALTLDARDTYIPQMEGIADPVRLRRFNEIQHRVSGQLRSLLSNDRERYPDEVFLGMLLEAVTSLRGSFLKAELEKLGGQSVQPRRTGRRAG